MRRGVCRRVYASPTAVGVDARFAWLSAEPITIISEPVRSISRPSAPHWSRLVLHLCPAGYARRARTKRSRLGCRHGPSCSTAFVGVGVVARAQVERLHDDREL